MRLVAASITDAHLKVVRSILHDLRIAVFGRLDLDHEYRRLDENVRVGACATEWSPLCSEVICAFNDRFQDLSAHPGFSPTTLNHNIYLDIFSDLETIQAHDRDLHEIHPHNGILHTHSMTRILARKPSLRRETQT
jgi:hypothetical protein